MSEAVQIPYDAHGAFPQSEAQAKVRYERFRAEDPFPSIDNALLNSGDLCDYVATAGMIYPFYPASLKPASYALRLLGKCVYWDEDGRKKVIDIQKEETFRLKANSIAFVTLEPTLRLPEYMAMRFNLKIRHIYRGLLLGTGPLVDPGFIGKLSLPLHNLTLNDYNLRGGEQLVWAEFTKISSQSRWLSGTAVRRRFSDAYVGFPKTKLRRDDVEDYLYLADAHRSIRSSIPKAMRVAEQSAVQARKDAQEAVDRAERVGRNTNWFTWAVGLTLAIGIAALVVEMHSLVRDTVDQSAAIAEQLRASHTQVLGAQERIRALTERVADLERILERHDTSSNVTPSPTPSITADQSKE